MTDPWDKKLVEFLRKTGEDIKSETQRLVSEVSDPAKQQKLKEGLRELGVWAKKTAEEAAVMVEGAVRKAEGAVKTKLSEQPWSRSTDTRPSPPPVEPAAAKPPAPRKKASKTVGKKAGATGAKKAKPASSKTLGRKKGPSNL